MKKTQRLCLVLSLVAAVLLLAAGALHASGFAYVANTIADSQLPDFLKRVLPPLYLYPSALMGILAAVVISVLWSPRNGTFVLRVVSTIVAANAVLGFILGGAVPGGVLLLVAGLLWFTATLFARA